MVANARRDTYKAKFKKGQKCVVPKFIVDESGQELLKFVQGEIQRAEKRTVEVDLDGSGNMTQLSSYHYEVKYWEDEKLFDVMLEESELYKYHKDLISGEESLHAEQVRREAWQQHDYKLKQERLEKVPERLRLRIPVALKQSVLDDYERVCLNGDVASVLPRLRRDGKEEEEKETEEKEVEDDGDDSEADGGKMDVDEEYVPSGEEEDSEDDKAPTTSRYGEKSRGVVTAEKTVAKALNKDAYSVAEIIEMWRKHTMNQDDVIQDDMLAESVNIIAESLLTYFNEGVYQFLLYPAEVAHYEAFFGNKIKRKREGDDKVQPVDVYGVEHLVRLMVKLPELVCVQMMVLPVEPAKLIVAVEDRLGELMRLVEDWFYPSSGGAIGDDEDRGERGDSGEQGGSDDMAISPSESQENPP